MTHKWKVTKNVVSWRLSGRIENFLGLHIISPATLMYTCLCWKRFTFYLYFSLAFRLGLPKPASNSWPFLKENPPKTSWWCHLIPCSVIFFSKNLIFKRFRFLHNLSSSMSINMFLWASLLPSTKLASGIICSNLVKKKSQLSDNLKYFTSFCTKTFFVIHILHETSVGIYKFGYE